MRFLESTCSGSGSYGLAGMFQASVSPARIVSCTVRGVEAHPSSASVAKEGCSVLATLSRSDAYRSVLLSSGGVEVALASIQSFRTDIGVIDAALRVIVEIAQVGGPQRRRLVDAGALPMLLSVAKSHATSELLLVHVTNILQLFVGMFVLRMSCEPAASLLREALYLSAFESGHCSTNPHTSVKWTGAAATVDSRRRDDLRAAAALILLARTSSQLCFVCEACNAQSRSPSPAMPCNTKKLCFYYGMCDYRCD